MMHVSMEQSSGLWKMVGFKYFLPLWSVSSRIWAGHRKDHPMFSKNWNSMFYTCVYHGFYFALRLMFVENSAQTKKNNYFQVFLAVWVIFLKILGSRIYWNYMNL